MQYLEWVRSGLLGEEVVSADSCRLHSVRD